MSSIITSLGNDLKVKLKTADEVWIVVALMTSSGLDFLITELNNNCFQHYLIGINLPTEPKALKKLYRLEVKDKICTRIYAEKEFFHPKVYVIRNGTNYVAYIGSANCTNSGLYKNIELSYKIDNQADCKNLVKWFEKLNKDAFALKANFLTEYERIFEKRKNRKREDEAESQKLKKRLKEVHLVTMASRAELIEVLKWHRSQPSYKTHKAERKEDVKSLRESLDYPAFKNIDIDKFFNLWQLGHLIAIPIPTLKREINKFIKMLKYLCDDSIDIATRIDEVLSGDLKIRGVAEATVSKILTIHNPKEYAVRNDKIDDVLIEYGIEIPKRISKGEKYKAVNVFLKQLKDESNMDNLAILDLYLYIEATGE
jgi:HKD family nuclease